MRSAAALCLALLPAGAAAAQDRLACVIDTACRFGEACVEDKDSPVFTIAFAEDGSATLSGDHPVRLTPLMESDGVIALAGTGKTGEVALVTLWPEGTVVIARQNLAMRGRVQTLRGSCEAG